MRTCSCRDPNSVTRLADAVDPGFPNWESFCPDCDAIVPQVVA